MQVRFITGGKVQCDLAKCLPENPRFKGLCFRTGYSHLVISKLAPEICFPVSSEETSTAWVWSARSCLLLHMRKGDLDVSSLIALAPVQRSDGVSGQAGSCPFQKGSFQT